MAARAAADAQRQANENAARARERAEQAAREARDEFVREAESMTAAVKARRVVSEQVRTMGSLLSCLLGGGGVGRGAREQSSFLVVVHVFISIMLQQLSSLIQVMLFLAYTGGWGGGGVKGLRAMLPRFDGMLALFVDGMRVLLRELLSIVVCVCVCARVFVPVSSPAAFQRVWFLYPFPCRHSSLSTCRWQSVIVKLL